MALSVHPRHGCCLRTRWIRVGEHSLPPLGNGPFCVGFHSETENGWDFASRFGENAGLQVQHPLPPSLEMLRKGGRGCVRVLVAMTLLTSAAPSGRVHTAFAPCVPLEAFRERAGVAGRAQILTQPAFARAPALSSRLCVSMSSGSSSGSGFSSNAGRDPSSEPRIFSDADVQNSAGDELFANEGGGGSQDGDIILIGGQRFQRRGRALVNMEIPEDELRRIDRVKKVAGRNPSSPNVERDRVDFTTEELEKEKMAEMDVSRANVKKWRVGERDAFEPRGRRRREQGGRGVRGKLQRGEAVRAQGGGRERRAWKVKKPHQRPADVEGLGDLLVGRSPPWPQDGGGSPFGAVGKEGYGSEGSEGSEESEEGRWDGGAAVPSGRAGTAAGGGRFGAEGDQGAEGSGLEADEDGLLLPEVELDSDVLPEVELESDLLSDSVLPDYAEAIEVTEEKEGDEDGAVETGAAIGPLQLQQGQTLATLELALGNLEATRAPDDMDVEAARQAVAVAKIEAGDCHGALVCLDQALRVCVRVMGPQHERVASVRLCVRARGSLSRARGSLSCAFTRPCSLSLWVQRETGRYIRTHQSARVRTHTHPQTHTGAQRHGRRTPASRRPRNSIEHLQAGCFGALMPPSG